LAAAWLALQSASPHGLAEAFYAISSCSAVPDSTLAVLQFLLGSNLHKAARIVDCGGVQAFVAQSSGRTFYQVSVC
jgi:hypothetical protein